ncbi:MAG: lactonase family protein [Archangium sp.]|nr:lactonase family protein [Archangium sp.]MDP3575501.1 lactonase family protein [Archangium sp.]
MRLRGLICVLFVSACGAPSVSDSGVDSGRSGEVDAGGRDAGVFIDAGLPDAGGTDSGVPDAGELDAGLLDAGLPDAGTPDAGLPDAGSGRLVVFTGSSNGQIRTFAFNPVDGGLTSLGAISAGNGSSFLAIDVAHGRLYATNEGTNQIAAFALNTQDAGVQLINRVSSGGNGPAHVSFDRTGQFVFAANYNGGTVAVIPVVPDGGLAAPTQTITMLGQAHQIFTDPTNRFVYVPCKADDEVAQFSFNAGTLTPLNPAAMSTDAGAGPRHLALHPTQPRAYVINELGNTLQTLNVSAAGALTPVQQVSTLPSGFNSSNTTAEVAVHPNGQFVFGSNRGHDSIATWRVDPVTGFVTLIGHTPTGGQTPRHFSLDLSGNWLIVGNQGSGTLWLFRVNTVTGALTSVGEVATVTSPAFVGFVELPL